MNAILTVLVLLFTCVGLHAQTEETWSQVLASEYKFVGFSEDGAFAAYEMTEELVREDGKIRTQVFVVDVDKNDYATKPFRYDADSAGMIKFNAVHDSLYSVLKTGFRIVGNKQGIPIVFKDPIKIDSLTTRHNFVVGQQAFAVVVKTIPVSKGTDEYGVPEMKVEVDLLTGGVKKILQAPQRAPRSWGVTNYYSLIAGWYSGNKLALFLNYETAGFEGPGVRHQMIVTGRLN